MFRIIALLLALTPAAQAATPTITPGGIFRAKQITTPASTPSGYDDIYCKSGDNCFRRTSGGTEEKIQAGSVATSDIAASAVTNAKLANMATKTFKCRTSGSTGDPEDCTATQAQAITGSVVQILTQQSTPSSPSAGTDALYFKSDDKLYKKTSAGAEAEIGGGAGAGAFNIAILDTSANSWAQTKTYNSDIESASQEWAAYADAAGTVPVDMTGGSPNTTCARNTSSPIDGAADLKLTLTTGASRQGEGCSLLVNIPTAYRGQAVRVYFPYATTGTISAGDLVPYAYDVTNSALVAPSNTVSGISGAAGTLYSIFQTQTSTAQLRIGLHIARSSNTGAVTLNLDDFKVEPDLNQANVPVSDWVAFTPTYTGFGTVSTTAMFWRRVGDSVEVSGKFTAGTPTGTEARLSLPNGIVSDSTKVPAIRAAGTYFRNSGGGAATQHGGTVLVESGVAYITFANTAVLGNASVDPFAKDTGSGAFGASDVVGVHFTIPISGWSSGGGTSPILSLSDWVSFTPTITGYGTVTSSSHFYRRVGDAVEIRGSFLTGTVAASTASITIPSGLVIDMAKMNTASGGMAVGEYFGMGAASGYTASSADFGLMFFDGSTTGIVYFSSQGGTNAFAKINGSTAWSTGQLLSYHVKVPISGWTSTSSGTLTAPRNWSIVTGIGATSYGSTDTKVIRFKTENDCAGGLCTSAGGYAVSAANGSIWTIPVSGMYDIKTGCSVSGGTCSIVVTVNGTALTTGANNPLTYAQGARGPVGFSGASSGRANTGFSGYLIQGQQVRIQADGSSLQDNAENTAVITQTGN